MLAQGLLAPKARASCCPGPVGRQTFSRKLGTSSSMTPTCHLPQNAEVIRLASESLRVQLPRQGLKSRTVNLGTEQNETLHWLCHSACPPPAGGGDRGGLRAELGAE